LKTQKRVNEIYRDLVAKIGELSIQKEIIEKELNSLRGRIEGLNVLAPEMAKIEQELTKENKE
jgi:uncharacterized protein involved in exopolysaccharide biosynthesis